MASSTIFFSKSFLASCRLLLRRLSFSYHPRRNSKLQKLIVHDKLEQTQWYQDKTLVLDLEGAVLRSNSTFPYFMLIAIEAGSFLRGLILLSMYPFTCFLNQDMAMQVLTMISFGGLKEEEVTRVGRAVLPKHLLEDVGMKGLEMVRCKMQPRGIICVTRMPRVMVETFVREYVRGVEGVVGKEVKSVGGYYTGFVREGSVEGKLELHFGEFVGFGSSTMVSQHQLFPVCKDFHFVDEAEKRKWHALQRDKYAKPLVFHDGRLAFRPTPLAALAMYMWLPLGILLSLIRSLVFICLPQNTSVLIEAFLGMKTRINQCNFADANCGDNSGRLFICNHRTLLDPVYISAALNKQRISAVTYSVSRITELLSPIKTVRLTRNREEDKKRMEELLKRGDLVVCPEGTTCREPYLLRFSSLFAEVADEVHPVALTTKVGMFYGTSTGLFKFMDHIYFLMNPWPEYDVKFLGKMSTRMINGKCCTGFEAANHVQSEIGRVLGYGLTKLTRKDKYLMLAGNEGYV
ncbi:glycerol-3-phosphate acyltransferase 3 [Rhynchospora pubera]|uniref:Glycerol-3-phosphate acyltransferase 3 n=1 Tax=Rhynchospora pubera TaxID=906938 RepID=A0AAV8EVF4_9POAL|nr:glycerol-3-phosphate acyltransferase 3 [Rhynchospora pubera]